MTNSNVYKYYDVLGCSRTSTYDEIKKAYKKMALIYHPDKNVHSRIDYEKFLQIEEAWRILSDVDAKKKYDAECRQTKLESENILIHDRINLKAMTIDENEMLSYPCRCGSNYKVNRNDLEEFDEIHIPCQECTFLLVIVK